ncbi:Gfo/Idh/MocA family protein [Granulosicoccus antarcticus]|uniref:D-xylose dehydrogenase n=1 Tax=Granulosicoccus antarcticus IMCC3135 TaxID=1192854 RepID=A0A2Z2P2C1_9GAMM|nr:Gfo/Idh/MocA family oxidoreductase [Granulosicoccus antarcticus]ASJ73814.1 D-xylose dehydrogenase [Granulosicoccus antarcticus IMCC3135]
MKSKNSLSVGIIGCGNISTTYLTLAPLFKSIEVKAVADIDLSAAQLRATEYGVRAQSVDELLAAHDIDVIVNLTIPSAHFSVTRRILQAGKHAYSEKPLVLTLEEGKELRELADSLGLSIGSAPDTFLGASHQLARSAVDRGLMGSITGGTCHFMTPGMEDWHPNPDFFYRPGAGPVLDMGPYYLTNLVQLIGPARTVSAMASTGFQHRTIGNGPREGEVIDVEIPTNTHALIEFNSGAVITFGASWDVRTHRHSLIELYGTDATLYIPDPNFFGGDVELARSNDWCEVLPEPGHPFGKQTMEDSNGVARANYRCAGLADMADAIINGRKHRCNMDVALHVVDILTSIERSAATRQWVDMTTSCERPEALSPEQAQAMLDPDARLPSM